MENFGVFGFEERAFACRHNDDSKARSWHYFLAAHEEIILTLVDPFWAACSAESAASRITSRQTRSVAWRAEWFSFTKSAAIHFRARFFTAFTSHSTCSPR